MKALFLRMHIMSLVLFYFSGTGNTRYIARRICDTLNEHDYEAAAVSIENLPTKQAQILIDNASAVGIGWPIYGSDAPKIVKDFVKNMPITENKPLLTFCTQLLFSGDGAVVLSRQLDAKGYVQKWAMQFNMPNNLAVKGMPFSCSEDYALHEESHLKQARKKADYLAFMVLKNVEEIKGATIFHTIAAMSQRPAFRAMHGAMEKMIKINGDCNGCGLCVSICPTNALKIVGDKAVRVKSEECTLCMRCVDFCPNNAVNTSKKAKLPHYKGPDRETYLSIIGDKQA
jgi:formate hydrogenlyase subunit 6/NADH:ubiquinone oxidoreductase subunit I/menaquinone-dependent protoporphyrinogen IX oxidase